MVGERASHNAQIYRNPHRPLLKELDNDPRWLPFLRSIGRAPEQLAKIQFNPPLPKKNI
jgi:hypothetical protein